jgi:hypothetical protein
MSNTTATGNYITQEEEDTLILGLKALLAGLPTTHYRAVLAQNLLDRLVTDTWLLSVGLQPTPDIAHDTNTAATATENQA